MYKITVFLSVKPQQLVEQLSPFGFVMVGEKLTLNIETKTFSIRPLRNQREGQLLFGYHIECDASNDVFHYLLDMILQTYQQEYTGIEYYFKNEDITSRDSNRLQVKRLQKGIYRRNKLCIVHLDFRNEIVIQRRGYFNLKQLYECMREIEQVKEMLIPNTFDLFNYEQFVS